MKKKLKTSVVFMIVVAIVIIICMLLMIPWVQTQASSITGIAQDKIRTWAQTIAALGIGVMLVTWGISALAVPILGGAMIVIGLALIAYAVWPLFSSSSSSSAGG